MHRSTMQSSAYTPLLKDVSEGALTIERSGRVGLSNFSTRYENVNSGQALYILITSESFPSFISSNAERDSVFWAEFLQSGTD